METKDYRKWLMQHLNIGKEILYLTQKQCIDMAIPKNIVFEKTEMALALYSTKKADMPAKTGVHPNADSCFQAMPCGIEEEKSAGIKWIASYNNNVRDFGLPAISAMIIYNDYETGWPISVLDGIHVVELRTPAVAMVAAKYLANTDAATFGMIGCGKQGGNHVGIAGNTLKGLKKIYIFDEIEAAMDKVIADFQPKITAEIIKAKSYEELVKSSEIIASATVLTTNPKCKIDDAWIGKGQTILISDMHPLFDPKTMSRADKYLVDSIEQQRNMEHYGYYPSGLPVIYGELGEVVAGLKKGRERRDELIVCNNIGLATEDFLVAKIIVDEALEKGIGIKLPL